jgi:crotonobetainyl-CoA:carnitine CoA-transferase CaiB-like acyl-CoA transferase
VTWPGSGGEPQGPLAGVRILDLSRILAGPFSTQILADLGADVIKVERPGVGDETRRWGPPFAPSGDAAYFFGCNRGRRSLLLDLRSPEDQEVFRALATDADVLLENFLPGTMERMGLGDEVLRTINPRLVHGVISGYGQDSSREAWPALDFVVQAHVGVLSITGPDSETPTKPGIPIADLAAGLFATIGVLAALREAEQTGRGRTVEVSLAEACGALLTNQAMNYLIGGIVPRAMGNTHPNVAPYQVIRAQDKSLAIAATSDVQFERLCQAIGLRELAEDDRFRTNQDRVANREELERRLEAQFSRDSAAEWVRALNEAGVAAGLLNTVGEMLDDPDTVKGLVVDPGWSDGVRQLRTPIRLDGQVLAPSSRPPALGEHDREIRAAIARANGSTGTSA